MKKLKKSRIRQNKIETLGITFLRLEDKSVKTQIHHVVRVIEDLIEELEKKDHYLLQHQCVELIQNPF